MPNPSDSRTLREPRQARPGQAKPTASDRLGTALAGPDPDAVVHRQDEDLAVADLAVGPAAARLDDRVDRRVDEVLVDRDLELDLAEQVHSALVAAVDLGVSLLPREAL